MAIPSLQSLCIDAIANTLLDSQAGTTFTGLDTLPVDITEKLQQILIQKNGLNDTTLLMTTSPQQTNLNVPFSMANDAPCISAGAALHAINVRPSQISNYLFYHNCIAHISFIPTPNVLGTFEWPTRLPFW